MTCKKLFTILCIAILFSFSSATVYADSSPVMVQSYINEKNMDIFFSDKLDGENLSVKVANQAADVLDCSPLSDEEASVRTIILLDISTSMPVNSREKVTEFIKYSIENISKNEQLSIITFGDEVATLIDFTSDRYDLSKAAENIKFDGNQSAVYDAIYQTVPNIDASDESPCFYRTIAITDGADYAVRGVTKEELFLKLQAEFYPINVVCVSDRKPPVQNKDLSALTRISNGEYFELYSETDVASLSSDLSVSNYYWVRAEVPVTLLDGSTRQVDVSDGTNSISFDMKMSMVDAPVQETTAEASLSAESSTPTPVFTPSDSDHSDVTAADSSDGQGFKLDIRLLIVIAATILVVAIAVIIVAISKNRKNKAQRSTTNPIPDIKNESTEDKTEIIPEPDGKEHYSIKISNVDNPNDNWSLNVFSDIIIGRAKSCAVVINEESVSREQCKIAVSRNGLAISNLSSSNKTKLNGKTLSTEVILRPADSIHFGRVTLRVDYIQKVTDESPQQSLSERDASDGKTESVF